MIGNARFSLVSIDRAGLGPLIRQRRRIFASAFFRLGNVPGKREMTRGNLRRVWETVVPSITAHDACARSTMTTSTP